jgi:hypothetical protein
LARPTRISPSIPVLVDQAARDWYTPIAGNLPGFYEHGLVAAHELSRQAHIKGPWVTTYRLAQESINQAAQCDQVWLKQVYDDCADLPERVPGSMAASGLADLLSAPPSPATSKSLCDGYLDLFESTAPALARFFVPTRQTPSPARPTSDDIDLREARTNVDSLAKGKWAGSLAPLDGQLRNAIAHRGLIVDRDGAVHINAGKHDITTWTPAHLVEIIRDAICAVIALLAAYELHPARPRPGFAPSSVGAAEAVGFSVAPLQQQVEEYEQEVKGMVSVVLRGPRCDETGLLEAVRAAVQLLAPPPTLVFLRFRSRKGNEGGYWPLGPDDLSPVEPAVDRVQRPSRDAHRYQLRLERPYQ